MIEGISEDISIKVNISRLPINTFRNMRLSNYQPKPGCEDGLAAMRDLMAGKLAKPLVLIIGDPGLGKTHLAIGLAWERLLQNKSVAYWQVSELLDALRDGYRFEEKLRPGEFSPNSYSAIMGYARACHTLVLDDIGYQKDTDWSAEKLDSLVDSRYMAGKETIITSNTAKLPDRIFDRCKDGRIVMLKGTSHRGAKK
jgi:DNA replication protein DnaC